MDKDRALQLIQNVLEPKMTGQLSDRDLHLMFEELSAITGHPAPSDVLFHTFFEEDLQDGLSLTPEFLFDYMIRTAGRFKRYGG